MVFLVKTGGLVVRGVDLGGCGFLGQKGGFVGKGRIFLPEKVGFGKGKT